MAALSAQLPVARLNPFTDQVASIFTLRATIFRGMFSASIVARASVVSFFYPCKFWYKKYHFSRSLSS
jgi:hypothetical protein